MADLKIKVDGLKCCLENKFEWFWERKKYEMNIMIDEIVDGYLGGAIIVIVIK